MSSLDSDLDKLEDALLQLKHVLSRARNWEQLVERAGVRLDRPGATLLHIVAQCNKDNLPCNMQQIAHQLGIEAPSVSRKVQELEHEGLLDREVSEKDRRISVLQLTNKGQGALDQIQRTKRAVLSEQLHGWSSNDRSQLAALLGRLAQAMNMEQPS